MHNANRADVSVVIPCYQCSQTIERAIRSISLQTLLPKEIILVEDASGDNTLETLLTIQMEYGEDWIKVMPLKSNSGPATARNHGWDMANSKFVAFLDADDSWLATKMEQQYQWMVANPQAALSGHGSAVADSNLANLPSFAQEDIRPFKEISTFRLLMANCFPTRSVMLRRNLTYRFKPGMYYGEDYTLWCEIAFDKNPCFRSASCLAISYKPEFDESGLSGNLWAMQKGQTKCYWELLQSRKIGVSAFSLAIASSYVRFLRRIVIIKKRRFIK